MSKSPESNPSLTFRGRDQSKIPVDSVPNLTPTLICLDKNSNLTSQSCFQTGNSWVTRDHFIPLSYWVQPWFNSVFRQLSSMEYRKFSHIIFLVDLKIRAWLKPTDFWIIRYQSICRTHEKISGLYMVKKIYWIHWFELFCTSNHINYLNSAYLYLFFEGLSHI